MNKEDFKQLSNLMDRPSFDGDFLSVLYRPTFGRQFMIDIDFCSAKLSVRVPMDRRAAEEAAIPYHYWSGDAVLADELLNLGLQKAYSLTVSSLTDCIAMNCRDGFNAFVTGQLNKQNFEFEAWNCTKDTAPEQTAVLELAHLLAAEVFPHLDVEFIIKNK